MDLTPRARRTISTVLAVVLAIETVSAVAAAATTRPVTHELPADPPAGIVLAARGQLGAPPAPPAVELPAVAAIDDEPDFVKPRTMPEPEATPAPAAKPRERREARTEKSSSTRGDRASTKSSSRAPREATKREAPAKASKPSRPVYRGTNHVWIPTLGISRSVRWFPCDRERPPDNYMYRWGCAGQNNVYLLGHAYSVMEPLHDAYVSGRLRKGMKAWYADGNGKVRAYAVRWWKVTRPTTDAAWAWAPLDAPSMTLQTCVGRNSQYRLVVRLAQVDG